MISFITITSHPGYLRIVLIVPVIVNTSLYKTYLFAYTLALFTFLCMMMTEQ
jgi:hypothetical protein